MRFKLLIIGIAIAIVATTIGASGFTTATVERQADINVTNDNTGLLALEDGDEDQVFTNDDGELAIDMSNTTDADGLNPNATFTFGDRSDPENGFAFSITNNDDEDHEVALNYTHDETSFEGGSENLNFSVYNSGGDQKASFTETDSSGDVSVKHEETVYVVLEVDTTDATEDDDLDGTLNVTA
jgi:hypothetical protein